MTAKVLLAGPGVVGPEVGDTTTGWTQAVVTGVAPPNAYNAGLMVRSVGGAAGEDHYIDQVSLAEGTSTEWRLPGTGTGASFQMAGTEAPTTGTWQQNAIVWNSVPVAGGPIGWVCVEAGTPGIWEAFGTIAT